MCQCGDFFTSFPFKNSPILIELCKFFPACVRACVCLVPAQDFADTPVADPQLSGDVAGPHTLVGELHYSLSHHVWEGPAVYEHASQLVDSAMPCERQTGRKGQTVGQGTVTEGSKSQVTKTNQFFDLFCSRVGSFTRAQSQVFNYTMSQTCQQQILEGWLKDGIWAIYCSVFCDLEELND